MPHEKTQQHLSSAFTSTLEGSLEPFPCRHHLEIRLRVLESPSEVNHAGVQMLEVRLREILPTGLPLDNFFLKTNEVHQFLKVSVTKYHRPCENSNSFSLGLSTEIQAQGLRSFASGVFLGWQQVLFCPCIQSSSLIVYICL